MSQEIRDAGFIASDSRTNFKQIIAKRSDLVEFASGRMVVPMAETVYEAGLVLGQVTVSGRWAPYNDGHSDGTEVAKGVLAEQADVDTSDNGSEISIIVGNAELYQDLLIGLDAAAIVDLGAKAYVEKGSNLLKIS